MPAKSNTKEFIEKVMKIHGSTYDYSKVEYQNSKSKVIITCKEHGDFLQMPNSHLNGSGCAECGAEYAIKINKERLTSNTADFIEKSQGIHGDTYDYSKVEYTNVKEKVIITCKEHGDFLQMPNSHLSNQGCAECGRTKQVGRYCATTVDRNPDKPKSLYYVKFSKPGKPSYYKIGLDGSGQRWGRSKKG